MTEKVTTYISKPQRVMAIQYLGWNESEVKEFLEGKVDFLSNGEEVRILVSQEPVLFDYAKKLDIIYKDEESNIFVSDPDSFVKKYEHGGSCG